MKQPIYLDYNSTTPVDPAVLAAMEPYFTKKFGNPASMTHPFGWEADEAVETARSLIAKAIGGEDKKTIIFTSGATESNNLAIKGVVKGLSKKPAHIITQKTEHKCVLDSCAELKKEGHEVTFLDVDEYGLVNPDDVGNAIKKNTVLCSIMYANNEIGTIQPVSEISKICREHGVIFHTDAVQAAGKVPIDVKKDGIDLMSLSGHKIYGPKGIGALYMKRPPNIPIAPLLHGGGHERGLRSGTLNVPAIVGFAKAIELCMAEMQAESERLSRMRDSLMKKLFENMDGVHLNGHPEKRLPNNINISFDFVKNDDLILAVPELAIASGSACASGSPEPSYVMQALTSDKERVNGAVRIGLGRWTTENDVETAGNLIISAVKKLRATSLRYEMAK